MTLPSLVRAPAWVLSACLAIAGCGESGTSPASAPSAASLDLESTEVSTIAPRRLEPPADVLPIESSAPNSNNKSPDQSLITRYEQTGYAAEAAQSRILELAATPADSASGMIREPTNGPSLAAPNYEQTATAAAPRRSPFLMPDLPPAAERVANVPPPKLAERPNFNAPPRWEPTKTPSPPAARSQQPELPPTQTPPPPTNSPAIWTPAPEAAAPASQPPQSADVAVRAVADRAREISDRGFAMAQRGMPFAGCGELVKALQLVAQALDVQEGNTTHATALASGLRALEEAGGFVSSPGNSVVVNVADVVARHQTPILKSHPALAALSPVVAQQQYFAYAEAQLAIAAGRQPVSSQTLYRLGKLQTALAAHDPDPQALHAPQAIVFHQAALSTDAANYPAANELGVLLARYGQLPEAKSVLLHSVTVHPQLESWHNLATVHKRLGEDDLAHRAEYERDLLAKQAGQSYSQPNNDLVRWVDPQTFAKSGNDTPWPPNATAAAVAKSTAAQR